jgi:Fe2+ transport system protein B
MPDLWETAPSKADENQFQIQLGDPVGPTVAKMSNRLQERIRDLEQTLQEERLALAESQQRYNELERKYQDLLLRDLS